jgi:predicted nucleic acid-binding Zn ribbon protein
MTTTNRPTHCIVCGTPIDQKRLGPPRTTCSVGCRVALHRQRHPEVIVLFLGDPIAATLADPRETGHGETHELALEQVLWTVQGLTTVFDRPEERQRILAAVMAWLGGRRDRSLAQSDALALHGHLNPVLTALKQEAADLETA